MQGPGSIDAMGPYVEHLGAKAVLVADRAVLGLIATRVQAVCKGAGVNCSPLEFSGEITPQEVARLTGEAREQQPVFVIGAGGGKGIDAGKGVANALGVPVVTIPTAASNDAPTSKLYVLYDEHHRVLRVEHMRSNPHVVVVDTTVIAKAPVHLFTAGIGDAIVKKFEVAQCTGAGGTNLFGASACLAAQALADLCYSTLRERGKGALESVKRGIANEDVEQVVEATVLHSGLGFESGGLSVSHAMTRGLTAVRGARDALHGHQVAYALLVQLTLEERPESFIADVMRFYQEVDLPVCLAGLGLTGPTADEMQAIAEGTMTAAYIKNFQRPLFARDIAGAISAVEGRRHPPTFQKRVRRH